MILTEVWPFETWQHGSMQDAFALVHSHDPEQMRMGAVGLQGGRSISGIKAICRTSLAPTFGMEQQSQARPVKRRRLGFRQLNTPDVWLRRWTMETPQFEADGEHHPLPTVTKAQMPASSTLLDRQGHHRRLTQRPLLGGMLKRKTRQFMGFLGRNLLQDCSPPLPTI